ncbi:MAG: hypothetical protein A2Y38_01750 [Spirochaetes bacterium GWB1_59_5]|nr:MAG: hypothetical protein A2Y38_01750 [Spirochaetes bacterium GWB1_59_5]
MSNREDYLNDPFGRVEPEEGKAYPEYLMREAMREEDWESGFKSQLEAESFGREFKNKFLDAYKVENRETIPVWEPEKAAEWLKKKAITNGEFDPNKAKQIMDAAGAIDEKASEVLLLLRDEDKPGKREEGSPTKQFSKVETPERLGEVELDKADTRKVELRKKKSVAGYAILVVSDSCQLYKQGEKLAELSVEDIGGFVIVSEEIDAMESEKEVLGFFDVQNEEEAISKAGWFVEAAPVYDDPANQRAEDQKGELGVFEAGAVNAMRGKVQDQTPGSASLTPGAPADIKPGIPDLDSKI